MRPFSFFDYVAFGIGAFGTLSVFGTPIGLPQLVVNVLIVFSGIIFCFSMFSLALDRFVPRLDRKDRRTHVYYALANLTPTIYLLTHLKETPPGLFTC